MTWTPIARSTVPPERTERNSLKPIIWQQLSKVPFAHLEAMYDSKILTVASRMEMIDGKKYRTILGIFPSDISHEALTPSKLTAKMGKGHLTFDRQTRQTRIIEERI